MKTAQLLYALALICLTGSASAGISFSQSADGTISATETTSVCPWGGVPATSGTPVVAIDGNNIQITSPGTGLQTPPLVCNPAVQPAVILTTPIGKLVDGVYSVNWSWYPGSNASQFAVVAGQLKSLYSTSANGFWYDPNASGSGFNFEMAYYGFLVNYYGWDAAGNRLWLTSDIGPLGLIPDMPLTLNMSYTAGGTFTNPQHTVIPWGTVVLTFKDCQSATATLSGKDGTVNLNLVHLSYLVEAPTNCGV